MGIAEEITEPTSGIKSKTKSKIPQTRIKSTPKISIHSIHRSAADKFTKVLIVK